MRIEYDKARALKLLTKILNNSLKIESLPTGVRPAGSDYMKAEWQTQNEHYGDKLVAMGIDREWITQWLVASKKIHHMKRNISMIEHRIEAQLRTQGDSNGAA